MALWVVSRNALERSVPNPEAGSAWRHWKHFLCGGLAGVFVQLPTFPFDTLKKRLQVGGARASRPDFREQGRDRGDVVCVVSSGGGACGPARVQATRPRGDASREAQGRVATHAPLGGEHCAAPPDALVAIANAGVG